MELNREQIVKALEEELKYVVGLQHRLECHDEPTPDLDRNIAILSGALALIRELTEESERYKRYYLNHEYDKMEAEIKADTVRKMLERLERAILKQLGISTMERGEAYHFCLNEIDQIAKELLEEGSDNA